MTERRRGGARWQRRKKVSREEMAKFFPRAMRRQRLLEAELRARFWAVWIRRGTWSLALGALAFAVYQLVSNG